MFFITSKNWDLYKEVYQTKINLILVISSEISIMDNISF